METQKMGIQAMETQEMIVVPHLLAPVMEVRQITMYSMPSNT